MNIDQPIRIAILIVALLLQLSCSKEQEKLLKSPSGRYYYSAKSLALYNQLKKQDKESAKEWFARLNNASNEIVIGEYPSDEKIGEIESHIGCSLPQHLIDFWKVAPGITMKDSAYNVIVSPDRIIEFNDFYKEWQPTIYTTRIFVGGSDGNNAFMPLGELGKPRPKDTKVGSWDHEIDFTDEQSPDLYDFVAENITWYLSW